MANLKPTLENILEQDPPYVVYILECQKPGYVYVGYTNDFRRRYREHVNGYGAEFTREYGVKRVMYLEPHKNKKRAMFRETVLTVYSILQTGNFDFVGGGKYPDVYKSKKAKKEIVEILKDYMCRIDIIETNQKIKNF